MKRRFEYFTVEIEKGVFAHFRRHRFFRYTEVFQANCVPTGNCWAETCHGWGQWKKV